MNSLFFRFFMVAAIAFAASAALKSHATSPADPGVPAQSAAPLR